MVINSGEKILEKLGGGEKRMKTLAVTAVFTILIAALILPGLNLAHAATVEDGRLQLSPKAFGPKTSLYMCNVASCFDADITHKGPYDQIKKEELKSYKKSIALFDALNFMKNYYKTGF